MQALVKGLSADKPQLARTEHGSRFQERHAVFALISTYPRVQWFGARGHRVGLGCCRVSGVAWLPHGQVRARGISAQRLIARKPL